MRGPTPPVANGDPATGARLPPVDTVKTETVLLPEFATASSVPSWLNATESGVTPVGVGAPSWLSTPLVATEDTVTVLLVEFAATRSVPSGLKARDAGAVPPTANGEPAT